MCVGDETCQVIGGVRDCYDTQNGCTRAQVKHCAEKCQVCTDPAAGPDGMCTGAHLLLREFAP